MVEMEDNHKSEMKTMQTEFAAWTEVSLKCILKMLLIIDEVDNSEAIITVDNGSTVREASAWENE